MCRARITFWLKTSWYIQGTLKTTGINYLSSAVALSEGNWRARRDKEVEKEFFPNLRHPNFPILHEGRKQPNNQTRGSLTRFEKQIHYSVLPLDLDHVTISANPNRQEISQAGLEDVSCILYIFYAYLICSEILQQK